MTTKKNRLHLNKSEKISDLVEEAFSVYLDLVREGVERSRDTGDFKSEVEYTKELIALKERL